MLVLTLKQDEKILIGNKITVKVVEIRGNQIRLGIEAPASVLVLREKLARKRKRIKAIYPLYIGGFWPGDNCWIIAVSSNRGFYYIIRSSHRHPFDASS